MLDISEVQLHSLKACDYCVLRVHEVLIPTQVQERSGAVLFCHQICQQVVEGSVTSFVRSEAECGRSNR